MLNDQKNVLFQVDVEQVEKIYQVGNRICIAGRDCVALVEYG